MKPGLLLCGAGSLSHNGLTGAGRISDFATHKIEHELGGMFDVAHGAGLAAIWGSWRDMYIRQIREGLHSLVKKVFGGHSDSITCLGNAGGSLHKHANHPH